MAVKLPDSNDENCLILFEKVKKDLLQAGFDNMDEEIRNKMNEYMEAAKKATL